MTDLVISGLTTTHVDGDGAFDVIMRAFRASLDKEFTAGRLKGPEYSQVYLGSLSLAMQMAMQFVLEKSKNPLEAALLQAQIDQASKQTQLIQEQITLTHQQGLNAITENDVLVAQKCKLQAEFDQTQAETTKTNQETQLLLQKVATEKAQTTSVGVDADSVVGRQKGLYKAQTDGFARDAEQKAAKVLADTWSVRRTTDEGTVADGTNLLNDATVGRVITKLLAGVGA